MVMVAFGVGLEGMEIGHDICAGAKRWLRKRKQSANLRELRAIFPADVDLSREVSKCNEQSGWFKGFERVGLVLVVVGVLGEWWYGSNLEEAHNAIHKFDMVALKEAQGEARDASASAASIGEVEAKLKTDVDRADLILFAISSGQTLKLRHFNSLSAFRENVSVTWRQSTLPETREFAGTLSRAFESLGWHITVPPNESPRLPTSFGVTIYNKWVSVPKPRPDTSGGVDWGVDDTTSFQYAVTSVGKGLNGQQVQLLTRAALGLNATLEADPSLPDDLLVIVVNDAK
jgi:hypothetical protein